MRPRLGTGLLAAAVAAVAAAAVALSVRAAPGAYPFAVVAGKLWHLGLFGVFWFAVYAVGRLTGGLLFGARWKAPDLATAWGIVVFVGAAFVACAAGLAYAWLFRASVVVAALAGVAFLRTELREVGARIKRWAEELELSTALLLVALAAVTLPMALAAAFPPYYWDALTYHLAVPKAYAGAHGFAYLPHNVYASMPFGGSLFYLWPYFWDGWITSRASHLVATVLALSLTYRLARLWVPQFHAALASAFVLLTPPVIVAISGAHNDHYQILFAVAALNAYFSEGREGADRIGRSWLAVGAFAGAAVAVKYSAFAVAAAFIPIWIYDLIRGRIRVRWVLAAAAAALVLVGPWLVKAYVERGNPVFPLMYEVFGGRDFTAEQAERFYAWQYGIGPGRGLFDFLLLPYRVSVTADVNYANFSGVFLPFLLPWAAIAVVAFRRGGRLVAFGWLYLAAWFFGSQQLRFLGAALPAFGTAAAAVLAAAERGAGSWTRRLGRVVVVGGLIAVSVPSFSGVMLGGTFGYAFFLNGDYEGFLRENVGMYPAQEYINAKLPAQAKVLMVFTNHTLFLEREAVYDSFLEASPFLLAAEEARDPRELYDLAREWECTHLHVYHFFEGRVWPYYSPEARRNVYAFFERYGDVRFRDSQNEVYELVGD
ncbi:MAG: glycosyltransferase family 39 protein [Candidatus Coatesbacteria bacterium]|nr:MAG: glycosyltransferase family 39 protein [Candidatus Coatesbacteria bacterium]